MFQKCIICGKEFECKKSTKKYCSHDCELAARRIRTQARKEQKDTNKYCLICGKPFQPKTAAANQRTCCYECVPDGIQLGRSGLLDLIRKKHGGKCQRCGYNTYLGALDFHHINPDEKDFTIGNRDYKLIDCIHEAEKCVLLCANCHREIHAGLWDINEIIVKDKENE